MISQIPFRSQNSTIFAMSSSGKTAPDGLLGLLQDDAPSSTR